MRIFFHFSDFHIGISLRKVPFGIWFGKRAMGGANLLAGRRHNFVYAAGKPAAPVRFKNEQQVDLVICTYPFTGFVTMWYHIAPADYRTLDLNREYAEARRAAEPMMNAPMGYVKGPGNHDFYAADVLREGHFAEYFGDTL